MRRRLIRLLTVIVSVAVVVVIIIFMPNGVRAWVGGVLAAGMAAYLGRDMPRLASGLKLWLRTRRGDLEAPLTVSAKILDEDYVVRAGANGTTEIPASGFTMRLVIEAAEQAIIIVTGLRPEVLERFDHEGALVRHAGEVQVRQFEVLLDGQPRVQALADGVDFPFRIGPNDPEVFDLAVRCDVGEVVWVLHLDWVCKGQSGSTLVDLGGHPFRVAARYPSIGASH